jgi:hypothetical protein
MDLHDALHDLHHDFRGAVTDRPAGPVLAAARRRRTRTRVGYGAVGVGAAAALVVAGLNLDSWQPTPPPPAVTSTTAPAPTPTPTPTRTAAPNPTPSWTPTPETPYEPDLSACGTSVDPGNAEEDGPGVSMADSWSADPGEPLSLPWQVFVQGAPGDRVAISAAGAYLTQGGPDARGDVTTVIGVATAALPGPAARVLGEPNYPGSHYSTLALPLDLGFVMCPGADGAGGPPPKGDYLVWTAVTLTQDGSTSTLWGSAYGQVGPWTDVLKNYLPEGTTRYEASMDSASCVNLDLAGLGLTPQAWTATTGALTVEGSARFEDGVVVVSLRLANGGKALPYLDVRYPSFYVVTNEPFSTEYVPQFPAGTVAHASNTREDFMSAPNPYAAAPRWAQGASLGTGGSLDLETATGSRTCASNWSSPWASISYTVYAFTDVTLPDGTTARIKAAPITLTVP